MINDRFPMEEDAFGIDFQRPVSMMGALRKFWKCTTNGRASRSEYWWMCVWFFIYQLVLEGILTANLSLNTLTFISIVNTIIQLLLSAFMLLLSIRRMHDIGRSGIWVLINFIPIVGIIIFSVLCCKRSAPFPNQFGEIPNLVKPRPFQR